MKKTEIEELRQQLATLTDKINALEKKDKRPMDYDKYRAANLLQSKTGNKVEILGFLMQIRDEWNRIDEYVINRECGWAIFLYNDVLIISESLSAFKFKDEPTADLFLETFFPQLETIKELL